MTREKIHANKPASSGFTLIEIALAILVLSALVVAASGLIKAWIDQSTIKENQTRMAAIQQALSHYMTQKYRLPCPASYIAQPADVAPAFGREIVYPATTGCNAVAPNNVTTFGVTNAPRVGGPVTNGAITIGAVPVRDLGLPDSYIKNTQGYYFTYAVTRSATSGTAAAPMDSSLGVVRVVDQNNLDALPRPVAPQVGTGTALYALVDHGKDGKGAYSGSTVGPALPCTPGTGMDVYNCSFQAGSAPAAPFAFRNAPSGKQAGATWFDDTIVYYTPFSTSAPVCTTIYSNAATAGTSPGRATEGIDAGVGAGVLGCCLPLPPILIIMPVFYAFINWFHIYALPAPGYNGIPSTAVASCPDAGYNVIAGGCTQTSGNPLLAPNGSVLNPHGGDIDVGGVIPKPNAGNYSQSTLPPYSHPVLPGATGIQGWECNGSSSNGMRAQAYAVCCTGGGG